MNVVVNNGRLLDISGIDGQAAVSVQEGKVRVAFRDSQQKPEFKTGFKFELDSVVWVVEEVVSSGNSVRVASIKLFNED